MLSTSVCFAPRSHQGYAPRLLWRTFILRGWAVRVIAHPLKKSCGRPWVWRYVSDALLCSTFCAVQILLLLLTYMSSDTVRFQTCNISCNYYYYCHSYVETTDLAVSVLYCFRQRCVRPIFRSEYFALHSCSWFCVFVKENLKLWKLRDTIVLDTLILVFCLS